MWFKNLKVYLIKLDTGFNLNDGALSECLSKKEFTPLSAIQESTFGFVKPFLDSNFVEVVSGKWIFTAMTQEKILPASVISEYLNTKLYEIEQNEGRRPGKKEREQLKEDIRVALLPRAFHRTKRISAYFDMKRGLLVVNSPSDKQADDFTAHLREALGSLPIVPAVGYCHVNLTTMYTDPYAVPSRCLIEGDLSLVLPADKTVKANFKNLAKDSVEITASINSGMKADKFSMNYDDIVSFVVTEGLDFKRLKYSDQLISQAIDDEDPRTDTTLMLDTLSRLFDAFKINANQLTPENLQVKQEL